MDYVYKTEQGRDADRRAQEMSRERPGVVFVIGSRTVRQGGFHVETFWIYESAAPRSLHIQGRYKDGEAVEVAL